MAKKEKGSSSGQNVPDGEKVLQFVQRVENLHDDLDSERGDYMNRCKSIREDIKQVFKDAKADAGLNKKGLKEIIAQRALEAKLRDCGTDLEGDDSDAYAAYAASLEKLGELGAAAIRKAA